MPEDLHRVFQGEAQQPSPHEPLHGSLPDTRLEGLLGRVAMGDRTAFRQLYDEMSPRMYGLSMRLLRRPELAEEVLQDAFVRIWHNASEYHVERGTAAGWMLTITRYRALDVLRRRRFEFSTDHETLVALAENAFFENGANDDTHNDDTHFLALQGCLEQITPQQRQSILHAYYEGMSHEELAKVLTAPLGTVKSWVRRGLSSLKRCLEQ